MLCTEILIDKVNIIFCKIHKFRYLNRQFDELTQRSELTLSIVESRYRLEKWEIGNTISKKMYDT